jgi:methionyl aminopeptidase
MHADPHVNHTDKAGTGIRLKAVKFLDDGWTVVTADGKLSAQWEHTVIVTPTGHLLTTLL